MTPAVARPVASSIGPRIARVRRLNPPNLPLTTNVKVSDT